MISIDIDDSKGKIYTVQDCENGKTHVLSEESLLMHIIHLEGWGYDKNWNISEFYVLISYLAIITACLRRNLC